RACAFDGRQYRSLRFHKPSLRKLVAESERWIAVDVALEFAGINVALRRIGVQLGHAMRSPGLHTAEHPPRCTAEPAEARKTRRAGNTTPDLSPSSRCGRLTRPALRSHRDWPQPACAGRSRDGFRRSRTGGRQAWSSTGREVLPLP